MARPHRAPGRGAALAAPSAGRQVAAGGAEARHAPAWPANILALSWMARQGRWPRASSPLGYASRRRAIPAATAGMLLQAAAAAASVAPQGKPARQAFTGGTLQQRADAGRRCQRQQKPVDAPGAIQAWAAAAKRPGQANQEPCYEALQRQWQHGESCTNAGASPVMLASDSIREPFL